MSDGILDEAYERLHRTGPEFEGWLSNHGPMAVEALVRHGHQQRVHRWLDDYLRRLDEVPRGLRPIDDWREALGDAKRAGDWLAYFDRQLREHEWRAVLGAWWPRLLPGIAAGATHGVIRVGHAVRALEADEANPRRLAELGQALGYWASRWLPVPGADRLFSDDPNRPEADGIELDAALAGLPRIDDRSGGVRDRLPRLPAVPRWEAALTALRPARGPAEAERGLTTLIHTAGLDYLRFGHAEPVMLVHAVTAPTAVLRTLPSLDRALWAPSLAAAWAATAAMTAVYAPADGSTPPAVAPGTPEEVFARAARHGDEHVVKLADAILDAHARSGDDRLLTAPGYAGQLI
ncbi:questin oxidase family protein [Micromonospora sp. WMMD1120]|uniref:questin oxidase family protein n=1 Tax=Micromonospora sp. WMMD1120 TaxID=3016106 RepID=UPI0024177D5D|nr:questin oxidase family protein [Micromonospora sp. WMMD1120]MDG4807026.1 questin oxidase family protein [Micromonospora sp. WMMD1120]